MRQTPTAPIAAASLICGYAVAAGSGSRTLGGAVLAAGGLWCLWVWYGRLGARVAWSLAAAGILALVLSHLLALLIGAWPSVLVVAGAMAAIVRARADLPGRALERQVEHP